MESNEIDSSSKDTLRRISSHTCRGAERGRSIIRLEELWTKAVNSGDHRLALSIIREKSRMLQLDRMNEDEASMISRAEVEEVWGSLIAQLHDEVLGEIDSSEDLFRSKKKRLEMRERVRLAFEEAFSKFAEPSPSIEYEEK